jgi:hypothetical protein
MVSLYAYDLELLVAIHIHRVQPGSLLEYVEDDPLVGWRVASLPPVEVGDEEEYQVFST